MEIMYGILCAVIIVLSIVYIFNNIPPSGGFGGRIA